MFSKRGISTILLLSLVLFAIIITVGLVIWLRRPAQLTEQERRTLFNDYNSRLLQEQRTLSWKQFENDYFSFRYPENWILEDKTDESEEVRLILRSPQYGRVAKITPGGPYIISFKVQTAEQYVSVLDPIEVSEEERRERAAAIRNEDLEELRKYHKLTVFNFDHFEKVVNNDKEGALVMSGNENIFYGGELVFLSQGNFIKIKFHDLSNIPIPELVSQEKNLLRLVEDRPYAKIVQSVHIK